MEGKHILLGQQTHCISREMFRLTSDSEFGVLNCALPEKHEAGQPTTVFFFFSQTFGLAFLQTSNTLKLEFKLYSSGKI